MNESHLKVGMHLELSGEGSLEIELQLSANALIQSEARKRDREGVLDSHIASST